MLVILSHCLTFCVYISILTPNYQSELSIERAKCIANKFNSLVKDENTNLKQALNEIREYIVERKNLGQAENLDYYVIRKDILQIIDKVLGGSDENDG